jgi:hypothetical protein
MTVTDPIPHTAVVDLPRDCTFDARDFAIIARYWYPIALSRDVTAAPLGATLLDEPLVIYRAWQEVVVANDICPHRDRPAVRRYWRRAERRVRVSRHPVWGGRRLRGCTGAPGGEDSGKTHPADLSLS